MLINNFIKLNNNKNMIDSFILREFWIFSFYLLSLSLMFFICLFNFFIKILYTCKVFEKNVSFTLRWFFLIY